MKTKYLNLILTPHEEWSTKKYNDFIKELADDDGDSALQVIDEAIGQLQDKLSLIEEQLSGI